MRMIGTIALSAAILVLGVRSAHAENKLTPERAEVYPTWHALGLEIAYSGDDDGDGAAVMDFRRAGEDEWRPGVELTRDRKRRLWWGSIYPLKPGTQIEIRLTYSDPDGTATAARTLKAGTRPAQAAGGGGGAGRHLSVKPGQSIAAAARGLKPGDVLHVQSGVYRESVELGSSVRGTPERPIVILGEGPTQPVIDASVGIAKGTQWSSEGGGGGGVFATALKVSSARLVTQDGKRSYGYMSLSELKADKHKTGRAFWHDAKAGRLYVRTGTGKPAAEHSYRIGTGGESGYGFRLKGASHVIIRNIEVRHTSWHAFRIDGTDDGGGDGNAIIGCTVTNCPHAVRVSDLRCDDTRIWGNTVRLEGQIDCTWQALMSEHWTFPRDGMTIWTGRGTSIIGNRIDGHHNLISLEPGPGAARKTGGTTLKGNRDLDVMFNELLNSSDDAIEADYGGVNMRIHGNRVRNSNSGVSVAPCVRGPVYITRNEFSYRMLMFKFGIGGGTSHGACYADHNSGYALTGKALGIYFNPQLPTSGKRFRNNIIVSGEDAVLSMRSKNVLDGNCYWRVDGKPPKFNWGKSWIHGIAPFRSASGMEKHGLVARPGLSGTPGMGSYQIKGYRTNSASGPARVKSADDSDFRLAPGSPCIDRAVPIRGVNDTFAGAAPDIGAVELGSASLVVGPEFFSTSTVAQASSKPKPEPRTPKGTPAAGPARNGPGAEAKAAAAKRYEELKKAVIDGVSAGRRARVYVDLAGRPARARLLAADEEGVKVAAGGMEVKMKWSSVSPVRFYGMARKYTRDRAALYEYCLGSGLTEEAEREKPRR